MSIEWLQATTLDDLKACGSFKELRQSIKESLGEKISLKFRSWKELFIVIKKLKSTVAHLDVPVIQTSQSDKLTDSGSLYFQSEAAQVIYALVELDGEQRLKQLGIDKSYTRDLSKAKQWRNRIAKLIHPDVCNHPKADEASIKLSKMYEQMTGK